MKRTRSKPMNIVRTYLWFARAGKMEWLTADVRIGLGAAGETAAAAGILQALASALLLHAGHGAAVQLRVQPDFNHASFAAHAHCIFSCQSGDIILEAIRFALKKKKKIAGERDRVGKASH